MARFHVTFRRSLRYLVNIALAVDCLWLVKDTAIMIKGAITPPYGTEGILDSVRPIPALVFDPLERVGYTAAYFLIYICLLYIAILLNWLRKVLKRPSAPRLKKKADVQGVEQANQG